VVVVVVVVVAVVAVAVGVCSGGPQQQSLYNVTYINIRKTNQYLGTFSNFYFNNYGIQTNI
jgi:hypothetical protein